MIKSLNSFKHQGEASSESIPYMAHAISAQALGSFDLRDNQSLPVPMFFLISWVSCYCSLGLWYGRALTKAKATSSQPYHLNPETALYFETCVCLALVHQSSALKTILILHIKQDPSPCSDSGHRARHKSLQRGEGEQSCVLSRQEGHRTELASWPPTPFSPSTRGSFLPGTRMFHL